MEKADILKYLTDHKSEFKDKFGVTKIGLFGSFAKEENREESDIDIVVELEKPDLLTLIGIKQAIEEQLDRKVDIVRYRKRMNQYLKKRIDREATYV